MTRSVLDRATVLALDILITGPIDQGCGCPVAGNGHFKWTRGQILLCMYHHHSYQTPAQDFLSSTSRMDKIVDDCGHKEKLKLTFWVLFPRM